MGLITREEVERGEHGRLASRAAFSDATKGRETPLPPDPFRTEYQRDRDRIIHSKAFRRLMHKTQVFLAPEGDHYRTRLTHTLEVAQIARSIARALALNEDLTEAIALGHDLGHTPFGHIGEDAITACYDLVRAQVRGVPDRYRHNEQSLRVVEVLEYEGKGLNLCWEVRDGIARHTGDALPATLEGEIVRLADRIAYVNHDIDDAVRGGVLAESDLPAAPVAVLGTNHGARIRTMVQDTITSSEDLARIRMSPPVWDAMMALRAFLFDRVYLSPKAKEEEPKAFGVVKALFLYYLEHPDALPGELRPSGEDDLPQRVTDYLAGMTDRYALRCYEQLLPAVVVEDVVARRSRIVPSRPRFSVVMPAHQTAATLDESIASVLSQTLEDFELLVIENGSTDDTLARARRWSARDPRVYVTALEKGNVALARNAGIAEARGDYITFLDADDVYLPAFLATLEAAIAAHPGRTMYALGGSSVAPDGTRSDLSPSLASDRPTDLSLATVAWMTLFPNQVAYRAESLRALGGFRTYYIEDYDLWVHTFATGGTGVYVPAEVSEHRVFRSSRSHDPAFYEASVDSALASLRDAVGYPLEPADREAVQKRIALLERRRARIHHRADLEARLRRGEYARARRDYLRAAPAYRSGLRYAGGLALMLVSPRAFARSMARHEAKGGPDSV